jgi:cob(I)alamin adenosyltransferase
MTDPPFDSPRLGINRVYTRLGDGGETRLAGGQQASKDGTRISAYGSVDELNSFVGAARATAAELSVQEPRLGGVQAILLRVQHELFNLGSILATLPEDVHARQARVTDLEVAQLEREMDAFNQELPALRSFVLAGSSRLNAELDVCRTVCRRAERACVTLARIESVPAEALRYLNRLSDAFFVLSRWVTRVSGTLETLWEPNQAASGKNE